MAKTKKTAKQKKVTTASLKPESSFLENLEKPTYIIGFFVLLLILLAFLYKPMVFQGMQPSGSDITSGIGTTHQLKTWESKLGHYPLWNPYLFGGMPTYFFAQPAVWSLDTLLGKLGALGDWRIWYFLAGAIGMFLLIKYLGLSAAAGMLSALAFVLMPHFQALIIVGHFAKFRAIMWMPYVLLTALMLVERRTILSALLFAGAFSLQFRTQHYQIIFYTLMLVLFMVIPPLYRIIKAKKWGGIGKLAGLSAGAAVITFLVISQNLFSVKEYTPYSTRGGHAISLQETAKTVQEKKGVGFDYATNWSYSISEWWNLIIPKFHGGTSNELYTGNAIPAWKGRELPTYWGDMPFTQSYEYLGILVVFLAVIGIVFQWHRRGVMSLTLLTGLAMLMSLGKHFAGLYKFFFYYVPYFDKFRVPMMILVLVMFNAAVLAAYGLEYLMKPDTDRPEVNQKLYIISGIFAGLVVIPLLFGSSFSLTHAGEAQRFGQEVVGALKKVRLDMLRTSSFHSLIYLLIGFAAVITVRRKWLRKDLLPVIFIAVIAINFLALDGSYVSGKFINPAVAEQRAYHQTPIDNVLQKDNSLFRVFPVGQQFQDTRWSYYYQSLGGYSPAKLQTIQEIVDNCLYVNVDGGALPINWNVVNMMNVKYLVANQELPSPRLTLVASDQNSKLLAYRNNDALPRAYFVGGYQVIADGVKRLQFINSPEFHPGSMAVLEKNIAEPVEKPDSSSINITLWQPEKIDLKVYTDKPALMVLSEMYYPKGWSAFLDGGKEIEIYKTDHMLRSVVVPAGSHTLSFRFHPESYYLGVRLSLTGFLILYIGLFAAGVIFYRNRRKKSVEK